MLTYFKPREKLLLVNFTRNSKLDELFKIDVPYPPFKLIPSRRDREIAYNCSIIRKTLLSKEDLIITNQVKNDIFTIENLEFFRRKALEELIKDRVKNIFEYNNNIGYHSLKQFKNYMITAYYCNENLVLPLYNSKNYAIANPRIRKVTTSEDNYISDCNYVIVDGGMKSILYYDQWVEEIFMPFAESGDIIFMEVKGTTWNFKTINYRLIAIHKFTFDCIEDDYQLNIQDNNSCIDYQFLYDFDITTDDCIEELNYYSSLKAKKVWSLSKNKVTFYS